MRCIQVKISKGFSLLEAMIALVILSVGLLGVAGIIAISIKNNQGSVSKTQASWLAYDVIDRIRANRTLALPATGESPYTYTLSSSTLTGTAIADMDLEAWRAAVYRSLGSAAAGNVAVDTVTGGVTVTLSWDESRAVGAWVNKIEGRGDTPGITSTQTITTETRI